MWEVVLAFYALCAVVFFIAILRDKYVELSTNIVLIFIVASIFWPITGLIYILDVRGR